MTVKASIGQPTTNYATSSSSIPTPSVIVSNGTPVNGSMYIRTDGTAGARIYWYYGSWVAQTTP